MTGWDQDQPIPLSALQHAVYCLRQAALIHVEQVWADTLAAASAPALSNGVALRA